MYWAAMENSLDATQTVDLNGYHQQHQEGVALAVKHFLFNTCLKNLKEVTTNGPQLMNF